MILHAEPLATMPGMQGNAADHGPSSAAGPASDPLTPFTRARPLSAAATETDCQTTLAGKEEVADAD